jgi:CHASE2 domain-containing sensor protein
VILGITAVTFLLSWAGVLDHLETTGLDTFNILQNPPDPKHVVIVAIDDEDYKSIFDETSPLDSGKLQEIIAAIAKGHPKMIGVDIDTASERKKAVETKQDWPAIVWGQDALLDEKARVFHVQPVLGGRDPARNMDAAAIAAVPMDSDGIIRRYYRKFAVGAGRREDSFVWAVVKAACTEPRAVERCKEIQHTIDEDEGAGGKEAELPKHGLKMNFAGQRFNFKPLSARFVLQIGSEPGWETSSPLRGKIVLLGGDYHAARDTQITPVGPMAGVQLMAQAIETEFSGGGIRPLMNEVVAALLDLCSGAVLVYISYRNRLHLGRALLISLGLLVIFPLLFSLAAFSTLARWFNFVPMIVGVLLHEIYEHGREYQHLRELYLHDS